MSPLDRAIALLLYVNNPEKWRRPAIEAELRRLAAEPLDAFALVPRPDGRVLFRGPSPSVVYSARTRSVHLQACELDVRLLAVVLASTEHLGEPKYYRPQGGFYEQLSWVLPKGVRGAPEAERLCVALNAAGFPTPPSALVERAAWLANHGLVLEAVTP